MTAISHGPVAGRGAARYASARASVAEAQQSRIA